MDAVGLLCGCLLVGAGNSFRILCSSAARRPGGRCAFGCSAFCAAAAPLCRRRKALSAMQGVCRAWAQALSQVLGFQQALLPV